MSDYYDSGDDRSAKGKEASRYGAWEQSELEKHIFSWSLKDVLNWNLLKKQVGCLCAVVRLSIRLIRNLTQLK